MPTKILNERLCFPTASGYGQYSGVGQPARTMRLVENLLDTGTNSLRDLASIPNTDVVFYGLSGNIEVEDTIITAGNVQIHGQTGNVAIVSKQPSSLNSSIIRLAGNHSMIRFVRIRRQGEEVGPSAGGGGFLGGNNYMFDHMTYGAMSDDMSGAAYNGGYNATYQHCMFYKSVPKSTSNRGTGKGTLFYNDLLTLSMKGNLWAHVGSRSPLFKAYQQECRFEMLNNISYNWSSQGGSCTVNNGAGNATEVEKTGNVLFNMIGNNYITGANKYSGRYSFEIKDDVQVFLKDNYGEHRTLSSQPEFDLIGGGGISDGDPSKEVFTPFDMNYTVDDSVDPNNLEDYVLDRCGPYIYRDSFDSQMVTEVQNRTGETYNPADPETFTYPTLSSGPAHTDTTGSGIDDSFETAHGLSGDGTGTKIFWDFGSYQVANYAGYTNREMYWAYLANDFGDLPFSSVVVNPTEIQRKRNSNFGYM